MKTMKFEAQDDSPAGRSTWTIGVGSTRLCPAAEKKARYHRGREIHWQEEVARIEPLRKESATITEQPMTGGVQQILHYDAGLDQEYNTARAKRDSHKQKAEEYEAWLAFFTVAGHGGHEATFFLTAADIVYFGMGQPAPMAQEGRG